MKNIEDLNKALDHLCQADPLIKTVRARTGEVPWRGRKEGLGGLAQIITGQQLSVASARAIWNRFEVLWPSREAAGLLAIDEELMRGAGLSGSKIRTLRAAAEAVLAGLDLAALKSASHQDCHEQLTGVKGIGPWTADIYMMFCAAHPDSFAPGDLALRKAVTWALKREDIISIQELGEISTRWTPHRTAAAWLFWAYYHVELKRDGIGL